MGFNANVWSFFVGLSMELRTSALTRRSLFPNELLSVWRHWRSIFHARNPSMTQTAESSSEMSCLWFALMSRELAAAVWPANMSSLDHASSGWYPTTTTSFHLQTPPGLKISVVIPSLVIVWHISAISWCVIIGSCLKTWILNPVEGGFIFQPTFRGMNPNEHVELSKVYSYAIFHSAWRWGWGHFFKTIVSSVLGRLSINPEKSLASIRGEGVGFVNPLMGMVTTEVVENTLTMLFSGFVYLKMLVSMGGFVSCLSMLASMDAIVSLLSLVGSSSSLFVPSWYPPWN